MDYNYETFKDLEDLKETYPELATELLEIFQEDTWIYEQLFVYPTLEDYTKYELTEGWYYNGLYKDDYNGAPNPFDYIDLSALGDALSGSWDDSINYLSEDKKVVATSHGW